MSITICSAARNRFRDRLRRHKGGLFRGHYVCACPDWENERGEHLLSRKTLAQDRQHAFGVDDIVERYDRIVGEPGKRAFPFEARPQPSPGSAISLRASAWRRLPALQPPAPRFSPGGLRLLLVRLLR